MRIKTDERGVLYQESPYGKGYNLSIPIPRYPPLESKDIQKLADGDRVTVLLACDGPYECVVRKDRRGVNVGVPNECGRLSAEITVDQKRIGPGRGQMKIWRDDLRDDNTEPLLTLLKRYSYKRGSFTLASGKESDFYIDCKQTFLRRDGLWKAAQALNRRVRRFDPVAVAGEGVGGAPIAVAVSMVSGFLTDTPIQPIVVRKKTKEHGTVQKVEYAKEAVPEGSTVVLVEDVLTTGTSASNAVMALQAARMNVVAVVALVDRLEGARELLAQSSVQVLSLYNRDDFVR